MSLQPMVAPLGEMAVRLRSQKPSPRAIERGGTMAAETGRP